MEKIKIARVVTVPVAFVHIKAFAHFLKGQNAELTFISSRGMYEDVIKKELGIDIVPIEIRREIHPLKDITSLWNLIIYFRKNNFHIIHSSTPKAGLLVAVAGLFIPGTIRIHTFTGQRWATIKGPLRRLLKLLDKLIILLNRQCYADSPSQVRFLEQEGVAKENQVLCLHKGSYGGIDCNRFNNEKFPKGKAELLNSLSLKSDSIIVLFVGRVNRDKGIEELVKAFLSAREKNSKLEFVIVGPFELEHDAVAPEILALISNTSSIHHLGFKSDPERYFSSADIFCLPSYREGFGTVVLEAAACGLPTIGTKIPGLVDAVVDGETGILVELKNISELETAILNLANDSELRSRLGANARKRAREDFDSEFLARVQWNEYLRLLKKDS